ncbi:hypothetical protein R5W23_001459 [Gemmata sp. JC673]|uniref:Hsp70 family protein n=1 Tax=Gemmata algarum TaxID=2975278 RepID=A0ABU5F289_9BACT|nr:hypothetical protein [Gemmata algarum]MDY3560233.1 hypothetical protein [Gemmata algarum]
MAGELFCIDFGSSYTKVALRPGINGRARLIPHPTNTESGEGFCFPSAALADRRGSATRYLFGAEAGRTNLTDGVDSRRNWKPELFTSRDAAPIVLEEGLGALLASPAFGALVRQYRVPHQEVDALRALYQAANAFAVRPPAAPLARGATEPATDAVELAVAYFRDLRKKVLETATRFPGHAQADRFPTRLCVPAFGETGEIAPETRALFTDILGRAGWPVDAECPLISEPVANVIGVLSEGENVVWEPRAGDEQVNLGRMLRHGPLVKAYRAARKQFALLICDIGSYTADFALVRFQTTGDPDLRPAVSQQSVPLGIAALDDRVRVTLPTAKAGWWQSASNAAREGCKRSLYVERKAYATRNRELGDIGTPAELSAVDDCLSAFGAELGRVFRKFCDRHAVRTCDEVVLTGGGNHIPALREGLLAAVAGYFNTGYLVRVPPGTRVRSEKAILTPEQVRGGSALGGCSVYFNTSYH